MQFSTSNSSSLKLSTMFQDLTVLRVLFLAGALVLARWVVRGIYRVYFHPLSRFPGPKASAFTRLPHIAATAQGMLPQYVSRLHEKYGDVVRISPDELSFIDPQAWRDIYGHGSKDARGSPPPKNWQRYSKNPNGASHILNMQDPAEHQRSRRIFITAFSDRALTQQSPLFTKYADQLVDSLRKVKAGAKFDLVRLYNFTTFDVMGDLTFGESLHMLDNAEYDPWVKNIFQSFKRLTHLGLIYYNYPMLAGIVRYMFHKKAAKAQFEHLNHSTTRVTKRLEKGRASEGVDLWDLIFQQEAKGKEGITRKEMDVNAGLFMVAGTETTATVLSGLTYLLLKNPETMKKLVTEVRDAFCSSDDISMEAIKGMPYLNACIKEALRMYPPVPIGLPHLTPREGSTICGHYVPPNITVAAPHLPMYQSPKVFTDPKSFAPERWTGDERYAMDERSALQPFSVGPRDCLGKNMAYHEMRLILAKVMYNFDFELCPESNDWLDQRVYILWQKEALVVKVTPAPVA